MKSILGKSARNLLSFIGIIVIILVLSYASFAALNYLFDDSHIQSEEESPTESIITDNQEDGDIAYPRGYGDTEDEDSDNTSSTSTESDSDSDMTHEYVSLPQSSKTGSPIGKGGLKAGTDIATLQGRSDGNVNFEKCTVAFSLNDNRGNVWAITAGHCGSKGQEVYTLPTDNTFASSWKIGVVEEKSIMNETSGSGDWAAIKLDKAAKTPSANNSIKNRLDLGERPVSSGMCKQGATTNRSCGVKSAQSVSVVISEDSRTGGKMSGILDAMKTCALPGDSGGPVYDRYGIIGVTSSTSASMEEINKGSCSGNETELFYTPVSEVVEQVQSQIDGIKINKIN